MSKHTKEGTPTNASELLRHPFIIVLSALLIAWAGYRFGQWLQASGH